MAALFREITAVPWKNSWEAEQASAALVQETVDSLIRDYRDSVIRLSKAGAIDPEVTEAEDSEVTISDSLEKFLEVVSRRSGEPSLDRVRRQYEQCAKHLEMAFRQA